MANLEDTDANDRSVASNNFALPLVLGFGSVILFLIAHYSITAWAEASEFHHSIQHLMIFLAGCGVSVSIIKTIRR